MTAEAPRPFPDIPSDVQKIHIIGVCGTAMGSLAAMLVERGFEVRGSDAMAYPPMSDWLRDRGIDILLGYKEENLDWEPDLVVVGNVCRREYADAVAMRKRAIPYLSFPEALRHFFMNDTRNLVVTGTHGKTTTTGMLAWILTDNDIDPGFMVGGITGNFGSNYRLTDSDVFVVEGDEYDTAYFDKVPKFWHYAPFRATINNIEFDHADIYPDVDAIEDVFRKFVSMIPAEGSLWVNGDDPRVLEISEHSKAPRKTFGLGPHNDLTAINVEYAAVTTGRLVHEGRDLGEFRLPTIGVFNVRNMLGATALALDEGLEANAILESFENFRSVKKRQELVGTTGGITIYDDFAHHPTAVKATVDAVRRQFPDRRIWAIFEAKSNTSRRRVFQDKYPAGFENADRVILSKPWREDESLPPEELLDIDQLARSIRDLGPETELIPSVDDIVDHLAEQAREGDIILGLSGSSFGGFHYKLLERLKEKHGD